MLQIPHLKPCRALPTLYYLPRQGMTHSMLLEQALSECRDILADLRIPHAPLSNTLPCYHLRGYRTPSLLQVCIACVLFQ